MTRNSSQRIEQGTQAAQRHTMVVHGRLAMRELRLAAARGGNHGLQIMTFEQLAARLAGGLSRPVDDETLRTIIQNVLPYVALGELDGLKSLPGMVGAITDTLRKAWRAGIDLQARTEDHPRIASVASLENAVLAVMPPEMMRPTDLVAAAMHRLDHVRPLFGPIEIIGITELSPCWRPLLYAIAQRVPVRWNAGPRSTPVWLDGVAIDVVRSEPHTPAMATVSASTAYHEAIEAMRWARQLISSGAADPGEIAIASVTPVDYDDHFLTLRADASLDIHFVHGVKITACHEGQAAAALADNRHYRFDQIHARHFIQTGAKAGLPKSLVLDAIEEIAASADSAMTKLAASLPKDFPAIIHASVCAAITDRLRGLKIS